VNGAAEIFGRLLRRAREASGLTQSALAEKADLSENAIRAFERAERFPRASSLDQIVRALRLDTEAVLRETMGPAVGAGPPGRATEGAAWRDLEQLLRDQDDEVVRLVAELARVVLGSALVQSTESDTGPPKPGS